MAEKKIGGRTVGYDRLPADQGLKMLLRVLKVLGPAHGLLAAIAEDDDAKRDLMTLSAIASFVGEMDTDSVYSLVLDMAEHCVIDGAPVVPAIMELTDLLQTAMFAMQTEFGSFFADGAGSVLLKTRQAQA